MSSPSSSSSRERSILIMSSVMFSVTTWWILKRISRERERTKFHPSSNKQSSSNDDGRPGVPTRRLPQLSDRQRNAKVSERCLTALSPAIPYLTCFLQCLQDPCHPIHNPTGYISLCMAENKLMIDLLAERFMHRGTALAAFSDSTVYCYNSFLGLPVARQAAAYFLAKRFLFGNQNPANGNQRQSTLSPEEALQHIDPTHVALGSGLASLLHSLFYLLGKEGDACLIPAPYYAAFENDMGIVARIVAFPVHMANPILGPSDAELDLAFMQAKSEGLNPTFVLLTNPNNPLGIIYSPQLIRSVISWSRKRGLHTILDEIYALSTHQETGHGFESVIKVMDNKLGDDVHFVWAISKDFGASGLRVGFLYTQNEVLLEGLSNLNIFSGVSGPIQMVVSELLTDDDFVDMYLNESRKRLQKSYHICICKLEEMVVPFVPAEAGMFVYIDCTSLLPEPTFEWEKKLFDLVFEYAHVVLTPGESQRDRTPGMFRICYAWSSPEILEIAMERLSRLVAKIRRLDWDDLNETTLRGIL